MTDSASYVARSQEMLRLAFEAQDLVERERYTELAVAYVQLAKVAAAWERQVEHEAALTATHRPIPAAARAAS